MSTNKKIAGRMVYIAPDSHNCKILAPFASNYNPGSIWECDCGKRYVVTLDEYKYTYWYKIKHNPTA